MNKRILYNTKLITKKNRFNNNTLKNKNNTFNRRNDTFIKLYITLVFVLIHCF